MLAPAGPARGRKTTADGLIASHTAAQKEFDQTVKKWVRGNAEYDDVVKALPAQETSAMVELGRTIRKALGRR